MDPELIAYLDRRFAESRQHAEALVERSRQHTEGLVAETRQHTEALVAETRRHFGVIAEGLRDDIRALADGHAGLVRNVEDLRRAQEEGRRELAAMLRLSSVDLERRIQHLETRTADVEGRLARLEAGR